MIVMQSPKDNSSSKLTPKRWRSMAEIEHDQEFLSWLHQEFPAGASVFENEIERRHFLKIMGAAFGLLGFSSCSRLPQEKIVPYLDQPEQLVSGEPLFFATAATRSGFATGLLVRSNEGRPTKIEGNPAHSMSLGAVGPIEQAEILSLYDPDRSQSITSHDEIQTWAALTEAIEQELHTHREDQGARFRILTPPITSPTLGFQLASLLKSLPQAKWIQWDPISRFGATEGAQIAFGEPFEVEYDLEKAEVIVSFDYDFFVEAPDRLKLTRAFTNRRRFEAEGFANPNYLFAVEPTPSTVSSLANDRLPLAANEIPSLVAALDARLTNQTAAPLKPGCEGWIDRIVDRFGKAPGGCVVMVGPRQPALVHAWAHRINHQIGANDQIVKYRRNALVAPADPVRSLEQLTHDLTTGVADSIIILGGNPAFDAPQNFDFETVLRQTRFSVHLSQYANETSAACVWHIPETHFLESWGDARALDGSVTIVQPLIEPLFHGWSAHQILALLLDDPTASDHDIVKNYWRQNAGWNEEKWRQVLSDGFVQDSASAFVQPRLATNLPAISPFESKSYEICFHPDPALWDGSYANNAWLQELPKPFSKVSWDNPALVSPQLARELDLKSGEMIEITNGRLHLELPVWIQPGQAPYSISLHLGNGRLQVGRVGKEAGFNTYAVRTSDGFWNATGVKLRKTGSRFTLVSTQLHHSMEGRDFLKVRTMQEYVEKKVPVSSKEKTPEENETFYNPVDFQIARNQWGMVINLNTCIACNACVLACQSENNIPSVGKPQVYAGREMYWIRVDQYFEGEPENPVLYNQPVPCMHCENAPCELVCPVAATLHSAEGLNQQVYNRCIGTRYCSNNCPYKVRRFNFLQFTDTNTPSRQLAWNPDVTVRSRGVMEKCTYCIQRIRRAEISAERTGQLISDGSIVPACAQACPTQTIVFGDVADPNSKVSQLKRMNLNYGMLAELNTRPRTSYLAKVKV